MPSKYIWKLRRKFWRPINEDKIYLGDYNGPQLVRRNNATELTISEMEKLASSDKHKFEQVVIKK